MYADLHTHTTASDGTLTPTELVRAARERGLSLLAITDHDTTAGVAEARRAAAGDGAAVRIVPGVELSAEGPPGKCHLLGLGIDPDDETLREALARLSGDRQTRNARMAERLRALGVPLTLDEVAAVAPAGANVGRPHFAQALVEKGIVVTLKEAFDRFLGDGAPAYVAKAVLSPADAIALIHGAGGRAFVAHPGLLRLREHETHEGRLRDLQALGMDGVEAYYGAHAPAQTERFLRLARKLGLLVTGGSDFHGANKPEVLLGAVVDGRPLPLGALPPELLRADGPRARRGAPPPC
jgi:hypothetical protein